MRDPYLAPFQMFKYFFVGEEGQKSFPFLVESNVAVKYFPLRSQGARSSCNIWHGLQVSPTVGSPQIRHSLSSTASLAASSAGLILSIDLKIANFVPGCFSSILFSIVLTSFLNAEPAYGHGPSW